MPFDVAMLELSSLPGDDGRYTTPRMDGDIHLYFKYLHSDPQISAAFMNKVAAPIANKMFVCGTIP